MCFCSTLTSLFSQLSLLSRRLWDKKIRAEHREHLSLLRRSGRLSVRLKINLGFILPGWEAPWCSRLIFCVRPGVPLLSPSVSLLMEPDRHDAADRRLRSPGGGANIAILDTHSPDGGENVAILEKHSQRLMNYTAKINKSETQNCERFRENCHIKYSHVDTNWFKYQVKLSKDKTGRSSETVIKNSNCMWTAWGAVWHGKEGDHLKITWRQLTKMMADVSLMHRKMQPLKSRIWVPPTCPAMTFVHHFWPNGSAIFSSQSCAWKLYCKTKMVNFDISWHQNSPF